MALTNRTIILLLKLNEVLTEARREEQFTVGDSVDVSSLDAVPIASLTWNTFSQEYEIAELVEMRTNA